MVALRKPLLEDGLLRSSGVGSNLHRQRGDTVADEIVLVAADEQIAHRLGIILDAHAQRFRCGAHVIAERGFVQPVDRKNLQRHNRQKHIRVDVGCQRTSIYRGVGGEVLGPEQALFLRSYPYE